MVLVRHEVSVRAKAPRNQGSSNAGPSAASSSRQTPLPQQAYESTFQVQWEAPVASRNNAQSSLQSYEMQLMMLEQQNKKRLLAARQEQDDMHMAEMIMRREASEEREAAEAQVLFLEQQNKMRLSMGIHEERPLGLAYGVTEEPLRLLEQQNKKRLLAYRQEEESNKRAKGSEDLNAASREDYHLQQMALEHENGKKSMGAREQKAAHPSGSRNQGHDANSSVGGWETCSEAEHISQLQSLEEESDRRLPLQMVRWAEAQSHQHETEFAESSVRDNKPAITPNDYQKQLMLLEMQNKKRLMIRRQEEEAAKQAEAWTSSQSPPSQAEAWTPSQSPPSQAEDKWGKDPLLAGQGVISGYEVQLMALENRRREEATARSQTEVEFGQQRHQYLAEKAEMSRLSGQQLPGAPGSSCVPPGAFASRDLPIRAAPRPDAEFDDLYDS